MCGTPKEIYTFFMDRKQPPKENAGYRHGQPPYGASTPHGTEVAYIFGTMDGRGLPFRESDYEIGKMLTRYWVNFAEKGDPNGEGLPNWPLYTKETPFGMHVGDDGCRAKNIALTDDEQWVQDYTKLHPGMLCSLDGFFTERKSRI